MLEGYGLLGWFDYRSSTGSTNAGDIDYADGYLHFTRESDGLPLDTINFYRHYYGAYSGGGRIEYYAPSSLFTVSASSPELVDGDVVLVRQEIVDNDGKPFVYANDIELIWLSAAGDYDGDGTSNANEYINGTNPLVNE